MQLFFDYPLFSTILISGGIFWAAFKIGVAWSGLTREDAIESTIIHLAENGYIRHRTVNGEMELFKINDE